MNFGSRKKKKRRNAPIMLNLTSMIDVTFLLLIYFLVTSVLAEREDQLSPTLQTRRTESAGVQDDFQPQMVEVFSNNGTPSYRIGQRLFTAVSDLRGALEQLPHEPGVFIIVEEDVSVGFAIAAIQAARDAGFEQVTYVPGE